MKVSDYAIKHPKVILMLLVILLVFGLISAFSLRRSLIADMSMPTFVVITTWPGVGPEDIEEEITKPLEEVLGTLEGLNEMSSVSRNSVSIIELELGYNEETETRLPEMREKVNSAMQDLPEGLPAPPVILQYTSSQLPVMTVIVTGEAGRGELSTLCRDEIIPTLSRIPGIAKVNMNGDSQDIVEISADLDRLQALEIPLLDIAKIIPNANLSFPGGHGIYHGYNLNIRTEGRFDSLGDFEEQVLAFRDGQYIRLKDAARVEIREDRRKNYLIANGEDSLALFIMKQKSGDSISISREVRSVLGKMEKDYAGGLSFSYAKDDASDISLSMNSVIQSAVLGAFLAVLILFIFLHNRNTTFIISISIPLSILFTLLCLWAKGSSLDLVTLGGLTASIGMIVDASIVVLEMIQRHFDKGELNAREAASLGAGEVGAAVIASTATTLAAFFPILFLAGLAGVILKDVAWTIIFSLFSSMLVAIIVVPFLAGLFLKREKSPGFGPGVPGRIDRGMNALGEAYKRLLSGAIKSRRSFFAGTAVLLAVSVFSFRLLGFEFLAQTDMAEITLGIETPGGYTLEMTRDKVVLLDRAIQELIKDELETSYYVIGQSDFFESGEEPNRAHGTLKLKRVRDRKRHVTLIVNELQDTIRRLIPDLKADFRNGGLSNILSMATGGEGLVVNVYGNNLDTVVAGADQVRQYMLEDPNVASTDMDIRFNQREMSAGIIHQYLGVLGLSSYEAAATNRIVFNGYSLGTFYGRDKNYPIELRTVLGGGNIPHDILYYLGLKTPGGRQISYANFAELNIGETLSQINHRNKSRSITVSASLKDPNVRESARRIGNIITRRGLVPGASWEIGGSTAEMFSSFRSLVIVLAVAVFLVYAVMVIQFERFTQPLLVMFSIPFAMIGITGGLLLFGSSLNIVSLLGIITLAGVVVNNAIVLIDYINLLRDRYKMPLEEAVLTGAVSRLKPILMTTLTTLLGIIPLAIGMGEGSEIYSPLGQSIFGGLFSSTFITLFFIPAIYFVLEKRHEKNSTVTEKQS